MKANWESLVLCFLKLKGQIQTNFYYFIGGRKRTLQPLTILEIISSFLRGGKNNELKGEFCERNRIPRKEISTEVQKTRAAVRGKDWEKYIK